ncbi:hypothetical protein SE17_00195 [Kouleothrix aurantiaca]|uniref:Uncharacterized protein n=1 Tax=Kouleothrix aurantiaca TaxID=186479 RepID=A0A0P9FDX8_9CHLR|nr:hypothetical protein SE17_00195 [Kouleothrix aurantiaca]
MIPVAQLRAVRQLSGRDRDMSVAGLELRRRHIHAGNRGQIGEVATLKLCGFLLEVCANERDLRGVTGIVGDHLLSAAVVVRLKDLGRRIKIERHHLCAAPGNLGLSTA